VKKWSTVRWKRVAIAFAAAFAGLWALILFAGLLASPLVSRAVSGYDTTRSLPPGFDWEGVLVVLILWLGIGGIMLITVVDDAKARGVDSIVSLVFLVLFLGWIGLYL